MAPAGALWAGNKSRSQNALPALRLIFLCVCVPLSMDLGTSLNTQQPFVWGSKPQRLSEGAPPPRTKEG